MSAQVNFRTSEQLLADIDKLVDEGHFRTRTEAVNEALRMLVQRYRGPVLAAPVERAPIFPPRK